MIGFFFAKFTSNALTVGVKIEDYRWNDSNVHDTYLP